MQSYFCKFLVLLLMTGLVYPAADPPIVELLYFPQIPEQASQFFRSMTVHEIYTQLPADPEEKKTFISKLIDLSIQDPHIQRIGPGCATGISACITALCKKCDAWDHINPDALHFYKSLGPPLAHALLKSRNTKRMREIATLFSGWQVLCSYDASTLAICFKGDPVIRFMWADVCKTLVGLYIDSIFHGNNNSSALEEFTGVCNQFTDKEFTDVLHDLIFHKEQSCGNPGPFKKYLWKHREFLSAGSHPHIIVLQNIVAEMEERIHRWIKVAHPEDNTWRWFQLDLQNLDSIYTTIIHVMLDKKVLTLDDCAVLLEMCRSFYAGGEFSRDIAYRFGHVMLKLADYNIRPNTRLFPHDPTDNRTFFSQWMLMSFWHSFYGDFEIFKRVTALCTEQEIDAFIAEYEGTEAFNNMIKVGEWFFTTNWYYKEKWEGETGIHVFALRKLYDAYLRWKQSRSTLFGRLYLSLERELETFGKDDVTPPSYGYAYPSWNSPIYFKGTNVRSRFSDLSVEVLTKSEDGAFEHDELADADVDPVAPSCSTAVAIHQSRRRSNSKKIKEALCKFFGR